MKRKQRKMEVYDWSFYDRRFEHRLITPIGRKEIVKISLDVIQRKDTLLNLSRV